MDKIKYRINDWVVLEYRGRYYVEEAGCRINAYTPRFIKLTDAIDFANLISILD